VEDEESLKSNAVFGQLTDSFQDEINNLFADGVVTTCIVVGRVLFTSDHLLRVKQTTIWTRAYLICTAQQYFNINLLLLSITIII